MDDSIKTLIEHLLCLEGIGSLLLLKFVSRPSAVVAPTTDARMVVMTAEVKPNHIGSVLDIRVIDSMEMSYISHRHPYHGRFM